MSSELLTTNRKALTINLDDAKYGTFAEIGAGQEVARHFFQAGGAAGTVAKSISAYDMKFSDEIYGRTPRYVSRERLILMLNHEYDLLIQRLSQARGEKTTFFVFADTVAARSFKGTNECHGWMGVRFQVEPKAEPTEVIVHVRMWDKENLLQQQALGIFGVNLIYAALYYLNDPDKLIQSLADNLGIDRIEVDMVNFAGLHFADVDNRLMSLKLVEYGLTNAVMFGPKGEVLQPSEVLHKKAILVERGSFRPVTLVNEDMLRCALSQFLQEPALKGLDVVVLMEITIANLTASGNIDYADFLARVDTLAAIGNNVLISNYLEFYRLTSYFRRYTKEMVGVAMGINNLLEVFNEKYYDNLEGGILESFGRLFRAATKLYIYPMRLSAYERYCLGVTAEDSTAHPERGRAAEAWITAANLQVEMNLRNLYAHLLENHYLAPIVGFDPSTMEFFSRDILAKIHRGESGWERGVPPKVAELIKERKLFGLALEEQLNLDAARA
ncbi:MAG: TonB-dependent receptor [Verrucomicrobia bacterium]|nr:TonB-dependent receptor [Verrucomicrobiota bacterium]MBV8970212.1 TonB-dependent receptor [Verrucomicrobiota bacterium]